MEGKVLSPHKFPPPPPGLIPHLMIRLKFSSKKEFCSFYIQLEPKETVD